MELTETYIIERIQKLESQRLNLVQQVGMADGSLQVFREMLQGITKAAEPIATDSVVIRGRVIPFPQRMPVVGCGPNDPDTCQGDVS